MDILTFEQAMFDEILGSEQVGPGVCAGVLVWINFTRMVRGKYVRMSLLKDLLTRGKERYMSLGEM